MNSSDQSISIASPRPTWIAQIYDKDSGEDFLGLRAVQNSITTYLMPGIITITPRARYYAFYSWLLVEYGKQHPDGWSLRRFIRHREAIFVLANLAQAETHTGSPSVAGLLGSQKLSDHWRQYEPTGTIPLHHENVECYLQTTYGGFSNHTGVLANLAIARMSEEENVWEILPQGQELAQMFGEAVKETAYYRSRHDYDVSAAIGTSTLQEYGSRSSLDCLQSAPDCDPTLETLFAFNSSSFLPTPNSDSSTRGNMMGSLGLILEMIQQAKEPVTDDVFRHMIAYGLCNDYDAYTPSSPLRPVLAHWQMFQLREYYVYALYALWSYFLRWLRIKGSQTLDAFVHHLAESVDLAEFSANLGASLPKRNLEDWSLAAYLQAIMHQSAGSSGTWSEQVCAFAAISRFPVNEADLTQFLEKHSPDSPHYVAAAWILLSVVYLRLAGMQQTVDSDVWSWANEGGQRRRAMSLFVQQLSQQIQNDRTLLETIHQIYKDYVIAQHTLIALEKWRDRKANTFHFVYDNGVFDWMKDGSTGFTASRFRQASDMLRDLGLFDLDPLGIPKLTPNGIETLRRVCEKYSG